MRKVLVVEPHADDGTTSAGGTILRFKREKAIVWLVYFATTDIVGHLEQHRKVCELFGIDRLIEHEFAPDVMESHKQEIRNILFNIREEFKPDVVLCPTLSDYHQDHKAVAECCVTIFRDTSTILGYEVTRSIGSDFKPNFYIILRDNDVVKKLDILLEYKAQIEKRFYFRIEVFHSQMLLRGAEANTHFAEAFQLLRGRI